MRSHPSKLMRSIFYDVMTRLLMLERCAFSRTPAEQSTTRTDGMRLFFFSSSLIRRRRRERGKVDRPMVDKNKQLRNRHSETGRAEAHLDEMKDQDIDALQKSCRGFWIFSFTHFLTASFVVLGVFSSIFLAKWCISGGRSLVQPMAHETERSARNTNEVFPNRESSLVSDSKESLEVVNQSFGDVSSSVPEHHGRVIDDATPSSSQPPNVQDMTPERVFVTITKIVDGKSRDKTQQGEPTGAEETEVNNNGKSQAEHDVHDADIGKSHLQFPTKNEATRSSSHISSNDAGETMHDSPVANTYDIHAPNVAKPTEQPMNKQPVPQPDQQIMSQAKLLQVDENKSKADPLKIESSSLSANIGNAISEDTSKCVDEFETRHNAEDILRQTNDIVEDVKTDIEAVEKNVDLSGIMQLSDQKTMAGAKVTVTVKKIVDGRTRMAANRLTENDANNQKSILTDHTHMNSVDTQSVMSEISGSQGSVQVKSDVDASGSETLSMSNEEPYWSSSRNSDVNINPDPIISQDSRSVDVDVIGGTIVAETLAESLSFPYQPDIDEFKPVVNVTEPPSLDVNGIIGTNASEIIVERTRQSDHLDNTTNVTAHDDLRVLVQLESILSDDPHVSPLDVTSSDAIDDDDKSQHIQETSVHALSNKNEQDSNTMFQGKSPENEADGHWITDDAHMTSSSSDQSTDRSEPQISDEPEISPSTDDITVKLLASSTAEDVLRQADTLTEDQVNDVLDKLVTMEPLQNDIAKIAFLSLLERQSRTNETPEVVNKLINAYDTVVSIQALSADVKHLVYRNAAEFALRHGDYKKAITIGKQIVSLRPNDQNELSQLGMYYLYDGDTEHASKLLKQAIEMDPGNGLISLHLATLLIQTNSPGDRQSMCEISTLLRSGLTNTDVQLHETYHLVHLFDAMLRCNGGLYIPDNESIFQEAAENGIICSTQQMCLRFFEQDFPKIPVRTDDAFQLQSASKIHQILQKLSKDSKLLNVDFYDEDPYYVQTGQIEVLELISDGAQVSNCEISPEINELCQVISTNIILECPLCNSGIIKFMPDAAYWATSDQTNVKLRALFTLKPNHTPIFLEIGGTNISLADTQSPALIIDPSFIHRMHSFGNTRADPVSVSPVHVFYVDYWKPNLDPKVINDFIDA